MKVLFKVLAAASVALLLPLFVLAQVNTSATVQTSLLSELQSLQQQLASLEATLAALISAASSGSVSSTLSSQIALPAVATTTAATPFPFLVPAPISTTPPSASGDDVSSALLQAIEPSISSTTASFIQDNIVANAQTGANATSSAPATQAIQMDPSCIAQLFASGSICGGLRWCGSGQQAYWSSTACVASGTH